MLVMTLGPTAAWAEGGELYLELDSGLEMRRLEYVRSGIAGGGAAAWQWGPRFGGVLRYGLADDWLVGAGVTYSWASNNTIKGVTIAGRTGDLLADYSDLSVPVSVSYLWTRGYSWSALVSFYCNVQYVKWDETALVDPVVRGADGGLVSYPVALEAPRTWDWSLGLSAAADWRPWEWLELRVGPYVELRRAGFNGRNLAFGVVVAPVVVFGVGPSL